MHTCLGILHIFLINIDGFYWLILVESLYDDSDLLVLHDVRHSVTANLCICVDAEAITRNG